MAKFSHYAIAAARQAIEDANWTPNDQEKERTVRQYTTLYYTAD